MDVTLDSKMWKQHISLRDNRVKWVTSGGASAEAGVVSAAEGDAGGSDLAAANTAVSLSAGWVRALSDERDPKSFHLEWRRADVGYIIVRVLGLRYCMCVCVCVRVCARVCGI